MGKKEKDFLNNLEKSLKNLSENQVIDVGGLDIQSANFLKNTYSGNYKIIGPKEDKNNPGLYAIGIAKINKEKYQNA